MLYVRKGFITQTGLTLISLLISLTLVSILGALSVPSYMMYVQRSEMHEARNMLMVWQAEQIRFRLGNAEYAKTEENKSYLIDKYKKDSSSDVRVAVVSTLYNIWSEDSNLISFYKDALSDSSVNVKLTALDIINVLAREDALLRAYEMEKDTDPRIIRYLSRMYTSVKDESKSKWFNWAIKQVEYRNKSYVISKYLKYLLEKDNQIVWKACKKLEEEAIYENNKDVRYSSAVVIHSLRERNIGRIEDIRKDIVDKKEASTGTPYDLKLLEEKHQELLEHDKNLEEMIKRIYDSEINKNIKSKYEDRGFLSTKVPSFKEKQAVVEP